MPDLLTPEEASAYLWEHHRMRRSPRRLQDLRMVGNGPAYHRDGVVVRYSRHGLDEFAREQYGEAVRSTSQETSRRPRVTV
jgi:hypothetical protein